MKNLQRISSDWLEIAESREKRQTCLLMPTQGEWSTALPPFYCIHINKQLTDNVEKNKSVRSSYWKHLCLPDL